MLQVLQPLSLESRERKLGTLCQFGNVKMGFNFDVLRNVKEGGESGETS